MLTDPEITAILSATDHPRDKDGLLVSAQWLGAIDRYNLLPLATRQRNHNYEVEQLAKPPKPAVVKRPGVTKYSTNRTVEWGKKQGWKLRAREWWDRHGRSHDTDMGGDAIFEASFGMVYLQGALPGQWREHWERYQAWGGREALEKRNGTFLYVVWDRYSPEPLLIEEWA